MIIYATVSLLERLLPIEKDFFLWLNHHRTDFLDTFMYLYSSKYTWIPVALVLLAILIYKIERKEIVLFILCGIIIGLLCDMVSAELIKPFFARLRPSHHPDFKDIVDVFMQRRGGRFGFISNHAANGFGIAIFTSLLFRYRYFTLSIYAWVVITAYSRIYLGVHFISDIVGGFIWGTLVGASAYILYVFVREKLFKVPKEELYEPLLSHKKAHLIMLSLLLTVIYIIIHSAFFQIVEL